MAYTNPTTTQVLTNQELTSPVIGTDLRAKTAGTDTIGTALKPFGSLIGYIVTFLNDTEGAGGTARDGSHKARFRLRRNPGFKLLAETFDYHCRRGVTYHLRLTKRGGDIRLSVDGRELLRATDPEPLGAGHMALRTFRTWLWWDNIRVRPLL